MTDVSIIIPSFNSPSSCVEAISSCLKTENLSTEVIVIDDGSDQPVRQSIEQSFGPLTKQQGAHVLKLSSQYSIRYYYQDNQGAYKTRLSGVAYASGKFIKFLDHDDVFIEGVLKKEVTLAEQNAADVVMTNWVIRHFDEKSNTSKEEQKTAPDYAGMNCIDGILEKGCPFTSANLYRKNLFKDLAPVTDWQPRLIDDWVIALQICLQEPNYCTLPVNSYIWQHHIHQQSRDTPKGHVDEFYSVLTWLQSQLERSQRLTTKRKKLLADYYFKNAIILCQYQPDRWKDIAKRIINLNKNFKPKTNYIISLWSKLFGIEKSVGFYVKLKNSLK